jgi:glycosyltransferase involved in cell wall biosynthesis
MLCASAFTAKDVNTIGAYKDKCFKWGYFTKVHELDVDELWKRQRASEYNVRIMWCARFIDWKHPELPVKLAVKLKAKGYQFSIDMFGSGVELENTKLLAERLNVSDVVNFCGNRANNEIIDEMRNHDIFLFTSDKNEGWGAVLNEAMSCGCAVVASDLIGSVPFLLIDGENGCVFKSENLESLYAKVVYLIENPINRTEMSIKAYETMKYIWSPQNAAKQLIKLIRQLKGHSDVEMIGFGPCSKA